jgi:polynucleotide 5'-hydroxyl-kinase GRC3/NOL9
VNTQGWMRGLGYDMLLHILNKIQPHFICQLVVNENSAVTFPEALMQRMHLLRACMIDVSVQDKVDAAAMFAQQQLQRRQNRFHASDFRHIQLLSNLCATPQSMSTNIQRLIWHCQPLWDFNTKLTEKVPWQIAWKDIDVIILPSDSPIPTSQVLWALNGTVVGLLAPIDGCEREEVISIHQSSDTDLVQLRRELRYEPTRSLPSPDQYTCIGIGLIRGIDPERRMYHLLAPYPLEQLSRVTMLVRGHAELPVWCMVDDSARKTALSNVVNCYGQTIPYVKFGATEGVGALSWRVRHNIMRGGVNR